MTFNYYELNEIEGTYSPSTIKRNSHAFRFWQRALFQRALSVIEFDNLPKQWDRVKNKLYLWLFGIGYVAITDLEKYGLIFNKCTLSGFDIYYEPTDILINNPNIEVSTELKIGTDCAILKLSPDYMGVLDIVNYYANKLAIIDGAQNTSLYNSKMPFMLGAKNKAAAETLKKLVDTVNEGEPCVVFDKEAVVGDSVKTGESPFHQLTLFKGEDYITDKLLKDMVTILNQFDAEIGIPTIPYQKAERLVTAEAESRTVDAVARSTVWVKTLNDSLTEVNSLYGLNISARLTYNEEALTNG